MLLVPLLIMRLCPHHVRYAPIFFTSSTLTLYSLYVTWIRYIGTVADGVERSQLRYNWGGRITGEH